MLAIRVLVVDDEKPARESLRVLLRDQPAVEIAGLCATGATAVRALTSDPPIDVVFLDIELPDMSGFDVLRALEPDERPTVVFVTAFGQYAVAAFEASAVDYLVKPYSDERFEAALRRARRHVEQRDAPALWSRIEHLLRRGDAGPREPSLRRLVIRTGGRTEFLPVDRIDWVEAVNVYVRVHAGGVAYLIRQTMSDLEARLDPGAFARIHRGTIVNLARVAAIERHPAGHDQVLLRDGTRLRMSRGRRESLERALGESP